MANAKLTQKPVVAIDATTQFAATKVVNGVREVVQIAQADLKGLDGKSSIASITGASPANIPAVGQQVQYAVDNSSGFVVDQIVAVGSAATLKVISLPTATSIVLENVDATPSAVVTGTKIVPSGKKGANGSDSTVPGPAGANAFTTVTNQFTIPALNVNVTATVGSTAFMSDGMALQISGNFFRVASIISTTQVSLTNTLANQTGTIAATSKVVAAGEPGPTGTPGPSGSGGGATGLQFTYLNTTGTPASGQIRSADISTAGTVTISATDGQSRSVGTDVLPRLNVGAIIEIGKDATNKVRGTVTSDYNFTNNSFVLGSIVPYGTLANNDTVFLSIVSDAPSSVVGGGGSGLTTQTITASQTAADGIAYICNSTNLIEVTLPTTGTRFAVSNQGIGGYKIRNQSGVTGQIGTNLVDSSIKYIGNSNQFSYVEFFRLGTNWLAVASANAVYGADVVNNVKSLIHFNNAIGAQTAIDEADSQRVITLGGTAAIAASGKFGNCANLGGVNGNYVGGTISAPLGTSDFCVEWWMSTTNGFGPWTYLTLYRGTGSGFPATSDASGAFLQLYNDEGGSGGASNSTPELSVFGIPNQFGPFVGWYTGNGSTFVHIAIVRQGDFFRVYTNGSLTKSKDMSTESNFVTTYAKSLGVQPWNFRLGGRVLNGTEVPNGKIDEFRVTIGDPVYTAAFTPPTSEFTYP